MNGRIYDPKLGRMLQADPVVQDPRNSQSLNRYSYVLNNPLSYTDPSGYFIKELVYFVAAIVRVVYTWEDPSAWVYLAAAAKNLTGAFGKQQSGLPTGVTPGAFAKDYSGGMSFDVSGMTSELNGGNFSSGTRSRSFLYLISPTVSHKQNTSEFSDSEHQSIVDSLNELIRVIDRAELISDALTVAGTIFDVVTVPSGEAVLIGVAVKGAANKAIKKAFERQLKQHGVRSLKKSQRTITKNLNEHLQKLNEIKTLGGKTSSVEREIRTFKRQLDALDEILGKLQ